MEKLKQFRFGINRKNTYSIKWDAQRIRLNRDNLIPFWVADSDYPTCKEVTKELIKRAKHGAYGYSYVGDEYYDILKKWILKRYNYEIEKEWVVITPGIVNALYMAVKLFTDEKDTIVVSTPVYNPFFEVVKNNKRNLVTNKLIEKDDTYIIDYTDLEEKIKNAKIYILCNPHNPVGRVWKKEEIEKIVEICKKHNCILISDEIHCDLIMEDISFTSVGSFMNKYENIMICTAPSKTFNIAGLMDSNIIIRNKELHDIYQNGYKEMDFSGTNIFGMIACMAAYNKGEKWVEEQRMYLTQNRDYVYNYIKENIPEIKTFKLEGTYLMWFDMSFLKLSKDELMNGLYDYGVQFNNGSMYDENYYNYIRMNIACGRKQLIEGLECIKRFVNSIKKRK